MSEKTKNPLLGEDDPGESAEINKEPEKQKSAKAKVNQPVSNDDKLKAEAIAKFPKDIIAQTKYILDNSEHVNFIIPKVEGEIGVEEVMINGYKLTIQRNVLVSIPIQVAKILAEKYQIALEAGKEHKIDRASDVQDALA